MSIRFGTDGWRAVIGEDYTFRNVRLCAQGVSGMLKRQRLDGRGVVVGYDTRFGSEDFAAAVAEVTAGNGIRTLLTDRSAPTPVVSHNLVDRGAGGGLVVTASHNPPQWNGLKFKPDYGGSASPEIVAELEREVAAAEATGKVERMPLSEAKSAGMVRCFDPRPSYLGHVGTLVDLDAIRESGMTVLVDSMYRRGGGLHCRASRRRVYACRRAARRA